MRFALSLPLSSRLAGPFAVLVSSLLLPTAIAQAPAAPVQPIIIQAPAATQNNSSQGPNWNSQQQSTMPGSQRNETDQQGNQNNQQGNDRDNSNARTGAIVIPTAFQQLVAGTAGRILPIFGHELFAAPPTTFAPVADVPVSADYVLGPGDQVRITAYGQFNQQGVFTVDRTGSITIPEIGPVHVAGVRYSDLTPILRERLGRVYHNFQLEVSLGQLRSIQVFVVGFATRPGLYTISSLSTLLNALFATGGPASTGSLRNIELRRNNQTIVNFDLYDVLLHGDKSKDVRLESGDVLFIPHVGPQVAIVGSVNTQSIYELRGETSLTQLFELAGGVSSVAAGSQVRIESIYQHTERTFADVTLATASTTPLVDGDIVAIGAILDRFRNAVTLRGNVANPGRYQWHPGMRLHDLIPDKQQLLTRDYYRSLNNLGRITSDIASTDTNGLNTQARATTNAINNATANSSTAQSTTTAASLSQSLVENNSGFAPRTDVVLTVPDINWDYAVIERKDPADLHTILIPFRLGDLILRDDPSQNLELQPSDVVTVFSQADLSVPTQHQTKFVHLEGEFVAAGVYSVLPGETLRQVVARAGGVTPDAYLYASDFTRESTRRIQQQRLAEYANQLQTQVDQQASRSQATAVDPATAQASFDAARQVVQRLRTVQATGRIVLQLHPDSGGLNDVPDIALEDGDRFVVPRRPSSILVEGQVYAPSAFLYENRRRVRDYVERAGGPDRLADKKRAFVIRADGSVISKQYGNLDHAPSYPGDTIVIPPHLRINSPLRQLADIATIVGQLGTLAALVGVIAVTR